MNVRRVARLLPFVALLYLVGPVGFQLVGGGSSAGAADYHQVKTKARQFNAAELRNWRALGDTWANPELIGIPIVLTYHDVAEDSESEYAVTPLQFAEHMDGLAAAGAHVITAAEYRSFQQGGSLPPRSVMITFDDGTLGVWRYAEPILKAHNFPAVAFVITGFVGTRRPYYMNWDEIDQLSATGRWSIEAHTHLGHRKVPTSASGDSGSFLSHLEWLPEGRLESLGEYRVRVGGDLDAGLAELRKHGHGKAGLFAYPFSDFGSVSNDPQVPKLLDEMIRARFSASFNTGLNPLPLRGPFQYNRLTVTRPTGSGVFMEKLIQIMDFNVRTKTPPPGHPG